MQWFRMYTDFTTDWKIEALAFEDQRHFVFVLCLKAAGFIDQDYPSIAIKDRAMGRRLGLLGEALDNAKARLMEVNLINIDWQPSGWEKRQRASDSAAERMRKYRENKTVKKCDVKGSERKRNALRNGDALDKKRIEKNSNALSRFGDFWVSYPVKKSKGQAERAWAKLNPDEQLHDAILDGLERAKTSEQWVSANGRFIPHPATWLNARGWEDELPGGVADDFRGNL